MSIPLNRVKANGKVDLWDLGPQVAPKPPVAPIEPDKAKIKDVELAAAELEFEDAIADYKNQLRAYTAQRNAHRDWRELNGGPVKIEQWGCDATHSLAIEPDRYKLDLPKGQKPGKGQVEADKRAEIEAEELRRARSQDPMHSGAMP